MEQELVKRYTYAVAQRLPENQRADIEKELEGLIEDMLADRVQDRPLTGKDVEAVLLELGSPAVLADKYRGYQRYLIGPEVFPTYLNILKIVFMALGIAMIVLFAVRTILTPPQVLDHFLSSLGAFAMGCLQAFAWVTLIFAVIEYTGAKEKVQKEFTEDWKPADLPSLPEQANRIPRAEPVSGIIFIVLFLVLVTFSINLFGMWMIQDKAVTTVIPFFDGAVFRGFLPFIWAVGAVAIGVEVGKLVTGKWTVPLVGLDTLVHILNFALAFFMLSNQTIWNPTFVPQLAQAGLTPAGSDAYRTVSTLWTQVTTNMIYFISVIFAIEMISTAVKAYRMKNGPLKDRFSGLSID